MKVIRSLDKYKEKHSNLVIAFGNFDGVHCGHKKLLQKLMLKARELNGTAAVFTFSPHPIQVLRPEEDLQLILTREDKEAMLADLGIDLLFSIPFNEEFSKIQPETFISQIIIEGLRAKGVVVGYNFNFGFRGQGDVSLLKKMGLKEGFFVEVIPPIECKEYKVSSTLVRDFLKRGNIEEAADLLGYYPFLRGKVVYGDGRGKTIGFPTANLNMPKNILVPRRGVYIVKIVIEDKVYEGVANIGYKPTFNKGNDQNIEIHFFDFREDIYNRDIKVEFLQFLRAEKSFNSPEELVNQIKTDISKAKEYFKLSLG